MADGDDVRDLVPDDDQIRLIHVADAQTIGEKRNFGCEHARGRIVAHWDDDDYSAPGRLADQVERLVSSGKQVTGYCSMRFTDGSRSWLWTGRPWFALGTSLCYWRSHWEGLQFSAKQVGEDNEFVIRSEGKIVTAEAGDLMYATIHPGNTSPRDFSQDYKPLPA